MLASSTFFVFYWQHSLVTVSMFLQQSSWVFFGRSDVHCGLTSHLAPVFPLLSLPRCGMSMLLSPLPCMVMTPVNPSLLQKVWLLQCGTL